MVDKCPCLIPDENDNCIECGKHIDIPDMGTPDLGDLVGIIHLIDTTVKSFALLMANNTDPNNPDLPRLRLIGGVMVRVPHKILCKELVGPSYTEAKQLGYRGTMERWGEILQEAIESPQPSGV